MTLVKKIYNILTTVCLVFLLCHCAQVVPLTGGAKDIKAPELLSVSPANKSTNLPVHNTKIIFRFNEMISATAASQKLIINPLTEELPDISVNGKTLTVEFTKDLQPNTTYLLQFGNSVVDIHENNPFPGLTYIFSTGAAIDTGYITGKAIFALSQKPATEVNIMLYKNLSDTAPLRSKPDYMTKTDETGKYFLSAVKPGTYQAIALADKSKNKTFDAGEAIGFTDSPVTVKNDTVNFALSVTKPATIFIKKKNQVFWGYNRFILNDTFPDVFCLTSKSVDTDDLSFETRNDTFEVYYKNLYDKNLELVFKKDKSAFDTVTIAIPAKAKVDSTVLKGTVKISCRIDKPVYGSMHDDVALYFSLPVKSINSKMCFLIENNVKEEPLFTAEEKNEISSLVTTYLPQYKKRLLNKLSPQKTYGLLFLPGSIETFWGTFNRDSVKTGFKTFAADETGNLLVKLNVMDSAAIYILQVLNDKGNVVNENILAKKKESVSNFYNLLPGDYSLRLIKDTDKNKKFTPADFFSRVQAEPVWYNKQPLKIIAGWDIESVWKLDEYLKK